MMLLCRLSSNEYLPFNNSELLDRFDNDMKNNYETVLLRMNGLVKEFLNADELGNWLVRALLETIKKDPSTKEGIFYIDSEQLGIYRDDMLGMQSFYLPEFLLGIWHYILMSRRDNKIGSETYEIWHKPAASAKGKRVFISDIGKNWGSIVVKPIRELPAYEAAEDDDDRYDISEGKAPVILPGASIAPELTGEAPWILIDRDLLPGGVNADDYLANAYDKYSKVKTLLYIDSPLEFYEFYVCNDLSQKINIRKSTYQTKIIKNITIKTLRECSNFVLITGTGGLGKSMMMHHLLLDAVNSYDDLELIPIFISLKDYSDEYSTIEEYIYEKFESLGGATEIDELIELLESGSCVLLFDGFDKAPADMTDNEVRGCITFLLRQMRSQYAPYPCLISGELHGLLVRWIELNDKGEAE